MKKKKKEAFEKRSALERERKRGEEKDSRDI